MPFEQGRALTLRESDRIDRAVENVRAKAGYEDTGLRTRYLDEIYKRKTGGRFTLQAMEDDRGMFVRDDKGNVLHREVPYRGSKGRTQNKSMAPKGLVGG